MSKKTSVLLAENNADDALVLGLALRVSGFFKRLYVVPDGFAVLQYLKGESPYNNRTKFPLPQLVLLELAMPHITAFQVLNWIRQQPQLRHLPVLVLADSVFSPDVSRAYQVGANSFLLKHGDFEAFAAEVKEAARFWLPGSVELQMPNPLPERPVERTRIVAWS